MSDTPALILTIERMIFDIRNARYSPSEDAAKLTAWCGCEAWMRIRRNLDLMTLSMSMRPGGDMKLKLWGCEFNEDPDQPLDEIWLQSNGSPVRRLNTTTMQLDTFMGPVGVRAVDLEAMARAFKNGPMKVDAYPLIMSLAPARGDEKPDDPIRTRSFSINEWIALGLVYMPATRTYALTHAGKNAVEQYKAFSG